MVKANFPKTVLRMRAIPSPLVGRVEEGVFGTARTPGLPRRPMSGRFPQPGASRLRSVASAIHRRRAVRSAQTADAPADGLANGSNRPRRNFQRGAASTPSGNHEPRIPSARLQKDVLLRKKSRQPTKDIGQAEVPSRGPKTWRGEYGDVTAAAFWLGCDINRITASKGEDHG